MRIGFILLGGVAAIALLGAADMPALAQYAGNPPQYSTPAEQAQTQQLNEQNLNGTTESPAELNGETQSQYNRQNYPNTNSPTGGYYSQNTNPTGNYSGYSQNPPQPVGSQDYNANPSGSFGGYSQSGPAPAYEQGEQDQNAAPPPDAQQQQYDQQMQQYQEQQQDYQNQRQNYDAQRDRYEHNIRWYDQARWAYAYPGPVVYEYDAPRLMHLDMLAEPSQQLADVPIEGPNGVWVGRIRNIETGPDGRPARIEVALNHRVSVWVNPRRIRFDPNERVAFTNLTREDLWQMPGATVESYPM
ncbi:MAG TPA: hypothetical protein VMD53_14590 [Rhizomicrobium sp.]|nr:hypothetical protein [Rhizomicrobium sp.]